MARHIVIVEDSASIRKTIARRTEAGLTSAGLGALDGITGPAVAPFDVILCDVVDASTSHGAEARPKRHFTPEKTTNTIGLS